MSNRTGVKSAFEGLRPSIVREPARITIAPQDESKLLDNRATDKVEAALTAATVSGSDSHTVTAQTAAFHGTLLTKRKREVLVPVTFRIPQTLKEELNEVAKRHELSQTDLINEGIKLNLQRYV